MTDIEQKALALINTITKLKFNGNIKFTRSGYMAEALCRAIEQHEAFRREVSDAVCEYKEDQPHIWKQSASGYLSHFIIPAPKRDPLEEVLQEIDHAAMWVDECAKEIRAALEARGLEIREKNDD